MSSCRLSYRCAAEMTSCAADHGCHLGFRTKSSCFPADFRCPNEPSADSGDTRWQYGETWQPKIRGHFTRVCETATAKNPMLPRVILSGGRENLVLIQQPSTCLLPTTQPGRREFRGDASLLLGTVFGITVQRAVYLVKFSDAHSLAVDIRRFARPTLL